MNISKNNLSHITIGFRFEKTFRISDISGEICDIILHHQSTPFGNTFFSRLNEMGPHDKTLLNDITQNYLKITNSDIIFKYNFGSYSKVQHDEIKWLKESAIPFILKEILSGKNIKNYMRIGLMFGHSINVENLGGRIMQKLLDDGNENADQFSLSFGLKETAVEGLSRKGVDDFLNKIYIIKQTGPYEFETIFDFQYYFQPMIKELKGWNIESFVDRSMIHLDKYFYPFINKFMITAVGEKNNG